MREITRTPAGRLKRKGVHHKILCVAAPMSELAPLVIREKGSDREREREEDRRKEREREKTTAKGACMSVGTRETRTIHNRSCWRYLRYRWSNRELVRLFSQVHIRRVSWSHSSVCSIQVAVVISLPLRSGRRRRRHFPSTCSSSLLFQLFLLLF